MNKRSYIIGFFIMMLFFGCSKTFSVSEYDLPKQTATSIDDIFSSKTKVQIEYVEAGKAFGTLSDFIDIRAKGCQDKETEFSITSLIVTHPVRGVILVNAGLDSSFKNERKEKCFSLWNKTDRIDGILHQEEGVQNKLRGREPSTVVLTDTKMSSIAGLLDLHNPIVVICGRERITPRIYPFTINDYEKAIASEQQLDFEKGIYIIPSTKVLDIFGDGSVWAVETPGVTKGSVSYLVHGIDEWIFFIGASSTDVGFTNGVGPGRGAADFDEALESIEKIREITLLKRVKVIFSYKIVPPMV